jgi:hypothetical protein
VSRALRDARAAPAHTALWEQVDADRRKAARGVVRANARIAWCNVTLDQATVCFATQLLADCNGQRRHALYTAFFEVAPNEITRLALEGQPAVATAPTLSANDQVLALPDPILKALAEEFVAALPANVQAIVRVRRTG